MASRSPIWWDHDKRIIKERSFDVRLGSPPALPVGFSFCGREWIGQPGSLRKE